MPVPKVWAKIFMAIFRILEFSAGVKWVKAIFSIKMLRKRPKLAKWSNFGLGLR